MQRRKFIRNGLAIGGAYPLLPGVKKSANEVHQSGIKITNVRTYVHPRALYVKIETDAGISGWGEGDHDHTAIISKIIHQIAKPILIGQDPYNSEYIWNQVFFTGEDVGTNGAATGALAGIDNALWDLKGKASNLPVYKLLGGNKTDKIKVYGSFGRGEGSEVQSPEVCGKRAAKFVEQGYDTVKLRMQIRTLGRNPDPDPTFEYASAVRKAIGDKTRLFIDFNNGYTPGKAIELIRKLHEHLNVELVEEPVSYKDYNGLKQCVESSTISIAAGEHEFNRWEIRDLILHGNPDIINLDVIKGGGLTEMKKAANLVTAFEKEVMCHSTRPTLGTAAMLHLIASTVNPARIQEHAGSRPEMKLSELFTNEIKFENGFLHVPQLPGLGLEVNEKAMKAFEVN